MKKLQRITATVLALCLAMSLGGCGGSTNNSGNGSVTNNEQSASTDLVDGEYKIGIIQMMDHEALNAARDGFVEALADKGLVEGKNLTIDYQNGQGDQNNLATIADQFVADNEDLILAIATPSAQAVASKTTDIPIIGTAITSYTEAGLAETDEQPGGNVTGTTDMNPIEQQIDLLLELCPDVKTVGFLYNSSEDNSTLQVAMAKEICEAKGLATTEKTVSSTNDVQQATSAIVTECDAIYLPTDNVFASSMPIVNEITVESKTPVFCGESGMVTGGGFATLGITYKGIGYSAGEMAYDVLVNGATPATMPIKGSAEYEYCFNGTVAKAIGVEIPEKYAEYVIE